MKKMNDIKKYCARVAMGVGAVIIPSASYAAVDLTGVTLDHTTPEALAATVLTSLGVLWGIRKLIKLVNRS
jgi:hypothetical protein